MSNSWYYVEDGERRGPIDQTVLEENIATGVVKENDYIWTKGFDNWKKVKDIPEFEKFLNGEIEIPKNSSDFDLTTLNPEEKIFTIKTGIDRNGSSSEYGPFSLNILKRLFRENRINAKTLIFTPGLSDWYFLADVAGYESIFEEVPPIIEEMERRENSRKPFVARMLFHDKKKVYEGTCRDISVGGMQVLVSGIPLQKGDEISLNVHPENGDYSFVASGKVVRLLEGGQGFSFRFTELNEEAKSAINNYLESE